MSNPKGNFIKTEDVVISGISGAFPQSVNVEEFKKNLFAEKNLIQDIYRWGADITNIPKKAGLIETIDRFDHSFFRVTRKHAEQMEAGARMLLEKTFEAIIDAGYNPEQLKGTKTGVFYGSYDVGAHIDSKANVVIDEYWALSKSSALMANRISYWLDIHGPSLALDTACSSSFFAFDCAYKSIQNGDCDAAIVCSANVDITPEASRAFLSLGVLDPIGNSQPFDAQANGFSRGEAVTVCFLQKLKDARRVYANIIHTTTNCDGFKQEGIAFPSKALQIDLFKLFYQDVDFSPSSISYIEAHGTGTRVGDIVEVTAIDEFFCANRNAPLKIGSVKSNMGHGEGSSGLCSLIKLIIAFETGMIPPTINLKTPNPKIDAFHNGHVQVVTKPTPCEGEFFASSSYGFGGANAHVVISPHKKSKKHVNSTCTDQLPYLVTVSGRTQEAVNVIINEVEKNRSDVEYIALMHEIFSNDICGHLHRGYVILNKQIEVKKHQKFVSGEKRPIWFIFSGMGSQWPGMGKSLMKIPIFAESIRRSDQTLRSKRVNLIQIITDDDPQIFKNILNSFVGIAAIQIALCDILKALNVKPDGIIGHSVGEMGCAYADGCLTAEQMILAAYYRGLVSLETEFIHGTMAAVGASYDVTKDLIPPEIDIACHNGPSSCTISGPTDVVKDFMKQLQEKKIFVREVNTSNIAYHSRYIASAAPKFLAYLKKIIPKPNLRSDKWICTSAPEYEWNTKKIKYSSAEYHTNNLLSPVYFEESSHYIPENAITIEISPHGLLKSILKQSLPNTVDNIPLTLKDHQDGVEFLLTALGQLYEVGVVPKLKNLYPAIQFPVSRSTPMISPLIHWQHDEIWPIRKYDQKSNITGERDVTINYEREEYRYLKDHVIDGRNLYPAVGYLELVWETMAIMQETNLKQLPIVFENIRFERATNIPENGSTMFHISIRKASGQFEITENNMTIVTGTIRIPADIEEENINVSQFDEEKIFNSNITTLALNKKDFYKELKLRGYHYSGLFKTIVSCNSTGTFGKSLWRDNFVAFMDTMAQMTILNMDLRELIIPTSIRKIVIDVAKHYEILQTLDKENPEFPIHHYPDLALTCSGGIQLIDLGGTSIARRKDQADPVLEKYQFIPYFSDEQMELNTAIRLCVHIVLENLSTLKVKTVELPNLPYNSENLLISNLIGNTLRDLPMVQASLNVLTDSELESTANNPMDITILNEGLPNDNSCVIVVLSNIRNRKDILDKIFQALKNGGFIITRELISSNIQFEDLQLDVCFSRVINKDQQIFLLRKKIQEESSAKLIKMENTTYSWIPMAQTLLSSIKTTNEKLVLYSQNESLSGILGFFNCLRKEECGEKTRCFFLIDENLPEFSLQNPVYKSQYDKNLSHNVYKNGQWGSYRHLVLESVEDVGVLHAFNLLKVQGDLSSLKWVEGSLNPATYSAQKTLIHVYYSALNFRDIMLASGKITPLDTQCYGRLIEAYSGIEYCGRDENGIRYAGISSYKGIASLVEGEPTLMWKVPDHMTLEEASTIAVAYATVVYAFIVNMNFKQKCSVLIHAGSGAVGQAAINICLYYKCNIFLTVGTPEKVEFIKKTYPQIPESNIGNSRNTSFEKMVIERTNGRGVDVVLNSLSEEKLHASLRCIAKHGHFIEIGKFDMAKNNPLGMKTFLKGITFHSVQLDEISCGPIEVQWTLQQTVQRLLDEGVLKPICRTVYDVNEIESAFRYMAAGKHIGKVVIKIRDEENNIDARPIPIRLNAQPRVICQHENSYVIIGGLGGFGLELSEWLMIRGARNIVLSSRNGLKNGYQGYKLNLWKSYGVNVVICTENVTSEVGIKNLLQTAISLGPVAGIFNVAVILKDGPFDTQTEETFVISGGPKSIATSHLDKLSRLLCPQLEYFVVFSSVSCGRGNGDQTNYGMSNSIMERICEARKADNLPALAIQWGAIGEVGVVADMAEENKCIVIGGTLQQKVTSCLQTLDVFMKQTNPVVSSMIVAEKRYADTDVINVIANILGIKDLKTISLTWTFPELGMDSIMAVETKQIIELEFDVFLSAEDLKTMTFAKLHKLKEEKEKTFKSGNKAKTQYQLMFDEKILNIPLLRIPFIEEEALEEISVRENPTAFMLPGLEGVAKLMEPLAKNLNMQILCFQYLTDFSGHTFEENCEYFSYQITQRLDPDQEFCIIAHSFGCMLGLEIARILEKQGRKGCLWFIDGSPDYITQTFERNMKKSNSTDDETLQCIACLNLVKLLLAGRSEKSNNEFADGLSKVSNWELKKTFCSAVFPKKLWSKSTIHKCLDKIYTFIKEMKTYKHSDLPLQMQCTLIRTVENIYNLDECYGLSKYFKYPVRVHQIEANHSSILEHKQTAHIIMKNVVSK